MADRQELSISEAGKLGTEEMLTLLQHARVIPQANLHHIQRVKQLRGKPLARGRPKTRAVVRTVGNSAQSSYHASRNPTLDYGVVPAFGEVGGGGTNYSGYPGKLILI
jgi:hypothetical protein